jgi:hypothetical protein
MTNFAVDGNTLVVGAINEDSPTNNVLESGAAYVFTRSGSTWSQQAYLKASSAGAGDLFGYSVAIFGDTLLVGAPWEDSNATGLNGNQANNSAPDSGAAYYFSRSASTWSQSTYLKASNAETYDYFGWSVAISWDPVVVGAPGEDSGATGVNGDQLNNLADYAGAAYTYARTKNITISGTFTGKRWAPGVRLTYTVGTQVMTFVVPLTRTYLITVPSGWSGTVTPSCPFGGPYAIWHCYFTPPQRTYFYLQTDQTQQNYQLLMVH